MVFILYKNIWTRVCIIIEKLFPFFFLFFFFLCIYVSVRSCLCIFDCDRDAKYFSETRFKSDLCIIFAKWPIHKNRNIHKHKLGSLNLALLSFQWVLVQLFWFTTKDTSIFLCEIHCYCFTKAVRDSAKPHLTCNFYRKLNLYVHIIMFVFFFKYL